MPARAGVGRGVLNAVDQRGESIDHVPGSCLAAQNDVGQVAQPFRQPLEPLFPGLVGDALTVSVGSRDQGASVVRGGSALSVGPVW